MIQTVQDEIREFNRLEGVYGKSISSWTRGNLEIVHILRPHFPTIEIFEGADSVKIIRNFILAGIPLEFEHIGLVEDAATAYDLYLYRERHISPHKGKNRAQRDRDIANIVGKYVEKAKYMRIKLRELLFPESRKTPTGFPPR